MDFPWEGLRKGGEADSRGRGGEVEGGMGLMEVKNWEIMGYCHGLEGQLGLY